MMPSLTTGVDTGFSMGFARERVAASEARRVEVKSIMSVRCQATKQNLGGKVKELLEYGKTRKLRDRMKEAEELRNIYFYLRGYFKS